MKKLLHLTTILLPVLFLTACSSLYQVLETKSNDVKAENNNYYFENSEVKINYNLWAKDGSVSFFIYNKLDEPIYVDWNQCHFIFNGTSYEYWLDADETKSFYSSVYQSNTVTFTNALVWGLLGQSSTVGNRTTVATTTRIRPKRVVQIPPKSGIWVYKFNILGTPYFKCDFNFKGVGFNKEATMTYTENNSPVKFRNYLTYSKSNNIENEKVIDNNFYVTSITNLSQMKFNGKFERSKDCDRMGQKLTLQTKEYPYQKINSFYIAVH